MVPCSNPIFFSLFTGLSNYSSPGPALDKSAVDRLGVTDLAIQGAGGWQTSEPDREGARGLPQSRCLYWTVLRINKVLGPHSSTEGSDLVNKKTEQSDLQSTKNEIKKRNKETKGTVLCPIFFQDQVAFSARASTQNPLQVASSPFQNLLSIYQQPIKLPSHPPLITTKKKTNQCPPSNGKLTS